MTALQILAEISPLLREAGIQFWVGGSIASSVWGDPRQTNDIDIAVLRTSLDEARLRAVLPEYYYIGPGEILDALRDKGEYPSFQILHMDEAFKFDVFLVEATEYVREEAARARQTEVLPGLQIPLASPEDIILHKLRWFESGGRVSDRQWNDIVRVIETQAGQLNHSYLLKWAEWFHVSELLHKALAEAIA